MNHHKLLNLKKKFFILEYHFNSKFWYPIVPTNVYYVLYICIMYMEQISKILYNIHPGYTFEYSL